MSAAAPGIIVRAPNWLGDTVMALPALAALRAHAREARLVVVGRWATLLAGQGVADALLPYPARGRARRGLHRALAADPPDVAVLLPNSLESALAARRWGARRIVGFDTDGRGALLTDRLPLPAPRLHQVDEYAALVRAVGAPDVAATPTWRRAPDRGLDAEAAALLVPLGGGPLVGLHLGAAGGSAKQWGPTAFAALARRLARDGLVPVLLGGPTDTLMEAAVLDAGHGQPVASLVGRDRPALLPALLGRLACLVSGDTGVAHLAAALGTPTVTLFGPTDPTLTAPRAARARTLRGAAPCAPCFLATCPIDHVCLAAITAEAAAAEVRTALAR